MPLGDCNDCAKILTCGKCTVSNQSRFWTIATRLLCLLNQEWDKWSETELDETVATIKTTKGKIGGWYLHNPNDETVYVQIFDEQLAVTVGSTPPDLSLGVPKGASANAEFAKGIIMSEAIKVACTKTATGNEAPDLPIVANIFYK